MNRTTQMGMRRILVVLALAISSSVTSANVWSERESLKRIELELKALEALIVAAENQSDQSVRIKFRYDKLRGDIQKIREGIQEHLEGRIDPVNPDLIDLINSDYTEK